MVIRQEDVVGEKTTRHPLDSTPLAVRTSATIVGLRTSSLRPSGSRSRLHIFLLLRIVYLPSFSFAHFLFCSFLVTIHFDPLFFASLLPPIYGWSSCNMHGARCMPWRDEALMGCIKSPVQVFCSCATGEHQAARPAWLLAAARASTRGPSARQEGPKWHWLFFHSSHQRLCAACCLWGTPC